MREYLLQFMGEEAAMGVQFMVALLAVLILFGVFVWFLRLITGKGRRKVVSQDHRLAILDRTQIDDTRSLVLVRRDDVEHLVMIGGPSDVVVESNIGQYADEHDRHSDQPLPGHEIARRVIAQRPLRTMSLTGSAATVAESIGLAAASRPEVSLAPPPPAPESPLIHEEPSFKAAEAQREVFIEPQSAEEAHPVVIPPEPVQPKVPAAPETVTPAPAVTVAPVAEPPAAPAPVAPVSVAFAPEVSMPVAAEPVPDVLPAPAPAPVPEILAQPAPQPIQTPQPAPAVVAMPEPVPEPQPEAAPQPVPQPVPVPVQPIPVQPVATVPVSAPVAPAVAVTAPAPIPAPKPVPEPAPEPVPVQPAPVVAMAPPLAEQVAPVLQPAPQSVPQPAPVITAAPQQAPPAPAAEPEATPRDLSAEMENALMQELEQAPASLSRVNHVVRQEQPAISTPVARAAPTPTVMPAASTAEQQGDTTQQDIDLSAGLAAAMGLEPEAPATPQYSEEQRAQDDLALEDAIAGMLVGDQPHNGTSDPAESSVYSASESVPEGPERPVDTTRPGRVDDEMSRLLQELAIPSRA